MKSKIRALACLSLAAAISLGMTGCSGFTTTTTTTTPYQIATETGYVGSESSFLAMATGESSQIRLAYEEAVESGYTGTYLDFLSTYLSASVDDSANINKAMTSVVSVWCTFNEQVTTSGGLFSRPSTTTQEATSAGSGVIYSLNKEEGSAYVITNYHVVYDSSSTGTETIAHISDDINLYLYGGEVTAGAIPATYVGGAMNYDIAVLEVSNSDVLKASSATAVDAANSDGIIVGEKVYALGNPAGDGLSVSSGVVSVTAEYLDLTAANGNSKISMLEIRTDAAINHGNSGGGLFNSDGRLIGIVNARTETSGTSTVVGFGYAIPANLALSVAQNIIDNRNSGSNGALRATLGITFNVTASKGVYDESRSAYYTQETVEIASVESGSAASGKLQAGDILYSVKYKDSENVVYITRKHMMSVFLFGVRKNNTVVVTVYRDNVLQDVEITFDNDQYFTSFS
jgi:serine protease Do